MSRLSWIDIAKAIAIVLVVFHHVALSGVVVLLPTVDENVRSLLSQITRALLPIRMPLFFFVSGLLAARAVQRNFREVFQARYVNLLWPYFLWSVIFAFVAAERYSPSDPKAWTAKTLQAIPFGGTAYWFLSLLVVFFFIAQLTKRIPLQAFVTALGLFAFAPLVSSFLRDHTNLDPALITNIGRFTYFSLWYFLGILLSRHIHTIARMFNASRTLWLCVLYCVIAISFYFFGIGKSLNNSIYQVLALLGLMALIGVSLALSKFPMIRNLASHIAARTLPIYVIHPVLIALFVHLVRTDSFAWFSNFSLWKPLQLMYYPFLTVALVAASLGIYNLCQRLYFGWLFSLQISKQAPKKSNDMLNPTNSSTPARG